MIISFGNILLLIATYFGLYSSIFLIVTLIEHWGAHHSSSKLKKYPSVCVAVPCYNEEKSVGRTIKSLLSLDYPQDKLEIIVVDDGSKDRTYEEAKKYKQKNVKVFRKKNGGKHTALNLALEKTKAEFFGGLDADSTVAPDSLKKLISRFDHPKVMAVTPSMIIENPKGLLRRIQSIEFLIGIFLRRVFADLGSQHVTPGPFTIYRTKFFKKYGGYRPAHMTEDIEVALRIQTHNYIIENATDAYVYTHGPGTWKGLYKQRLRWYYGFISNIMDYKHLISSKHGNLGLFILPSSIFSVALLSAVLIYTMVVFLKNLVRRAYQYWLIGFDLWDLIKPRWDSFFINTSPLMILSLVSLAMSVFILLVAKRFSKQKKLFWSWILFSIFYVWMFCYWWLASLIHKILKIRVSWGHKSLVEG